MDIVTDADLYYQVVGRTGTTRYFTLASVVWLAYDWTLTLGDEIELIWSRDWTLAGKPMYLFVRYGGMLFQIYDLVQIMGSWSVNLCVDPGIALLKQDTKRITPFSCKVYNWMLPIGTATFLFTMDLLLAYRALCLFRMNRKLLWINVVAFVLCATSTVALFSISVPKYQNIPTPEFLTGCWSILPSYDFAALIPGLLYELWLFALVVYKVITYVRNYGTKHMQGVFRLLVKDSSIWFFIVAGGILWNLLGMAFAPRGLKGIALPIFRNIVIICGCRMVLHLRKAYFVHANLTLTPGRSSTAYEPGDRTFGGTPRHPEESAEERAKKAIEFAQKIGLPPITKDELGSWDEEDAKLAENGQGRGSSRPHSSHSAKRSNGLKSKKPRRRDLEEGDDTDLRQVDVKGSDSQDCFEMVRVRVDVESHAVVEEAGGIGALTPRERRVRLAAGGGGTESSRLEMMRAMGQVEDDDDESEYASSFASSGRKS